MIHLGCGTPNRGATEGIMGIEILAGRPCENLRLLRPGIALLCQSGGRAVDSDFLLYSLWFKREFVWPLSGGNLPKAG